MISETEIQKLRACNNLLIIQINDLEDIISIREEELGLLRLKAKEAVQMKSNLDSQLDQLDSFKEHLESAGLAARGSKSREDAMESELLFGINKEKEYYQLLEKHTAMSAEVLIIQEELGEASKAFSKVIELKKRIALLESSLEIAELDRDSFREELRLAQGSHVAGI